MSTTAPPIDLQQAIEQLQRDLRTAEDSRITDADRRVAEIRQQLADKQAELYQQQEAESAAADAHQRQRQFALLAEMEKAIDERKTETVVLRRMLAELPAKLSAAEYQLNELLRSHTQLKAELKG
jgi:chromosome segregation ATPase